MKKVNLSRLDNFKKDMLNNTFSFSPAELEAELSASEIVRKVVVDNVDTFRDLLKMYNPSAFLTVSQLCFQLNKKYSFNLKVDTLNKWLKPVNKVDVKAVPKLPAKFILLELDKNNTITNCSLSAVELDDDIKMKVLDFVSSYPVFNNDTKMIDNFLELDVSNIKDIKDSKKGKY